MRNKLDAQWFLWPYPGVDLQAAVDMMYPLLAKSALGLWVTDPSIGGNLAEFIALTCRNWNVNPAWVMVSAQREQSTLTTKSEDFKKSSRNAWLGFVGQDVGRTAKPGYYGVYTQVERCCEQTAWLRGAEHRLHWPYYVLKAKSAERWAPGVKISVEGVPDPKTGLSVKGRWSPYQPEDAGEYIQLAYTPHWDVLATNEKIAERFNLV